jgi:hypothetical protein
MTKQKRLEIIEKIKYELKDGIHTFTMCKCGRRGSRGTKCWECLLEELK